MPKKAPEEKFLNSACGCAAAGVIAVLPGVLFYIAVTYQLKWLAYAVMIPILIIGVLFLLAVLISHSQGLKEVCNTLLLLLGIGFLIDFFFNNRK